MTFRDPLAKYGSALSPSSLRMVRRYGLRECSRVYRAAAVRAFVWSDAARVTGWHWSTVSGMANAYAEFARLRADALAAARVRRWKRLQDRQLRTSK